ncbi:MAG: cupin domain-containing protein [Candidatus Limnocylindria bacterium]
MTNVSTADWEADPEIGGLMHLLCDVPGLEAGLTRFDTAPAPLQYTPEKRETFIILEGAARIELGGTTLDLSAGGVGSIPAGTETTWHITAPFREFWVLSG